ncbi:MAG: hypothetical protein ACUVRQ_00290 [Thermoanaerobaculaceae bacterium]
MITNEIGQFTDDPKQTTAVMGKIVELGLSIAVWFSLDGPKAKGLVNLDGSLRPTGEAFRAFIEHLEGRKIPRRRLRRLEWDNPWGVSVLKLPSIWP